jgi:hypothetical protein
VGSTRKYLTTTCIFPDLARGAPFMIPAFLFGLSMRSSCQYPLGPLGVIGWVLGSQVRRSITGLYWIKML